MLEEYGEMKIPIANAFKDLKNLGYINYEYLKNKYLKPSFKEVDFVKNLMKYISSDDKYMVEFYYKKRNIQIHESEKFKIKDIIKLHKYIESIREEILHEYFNFYIYNQNIVDFKIIDSKSTLDMFIAENNKEKLNLLNNPGTLPIPDTFKNEESFRYEQLLTNQIIQKVPNAFHEKYKYIDILVSIYLNGAPTRLVQVHSSKLELLEEISRNTESNSHEIITYGYDYNEITDEDSDTVSILSTLSTLTAEEQLTLGKLVERYNEISVSSFNELPLVQKFIGEIEKRASRFQYIKKPDTIFSDTIVSPKLYIDSNQKRNSSFILVGLSKEIYTFEFSSYKFENDIYKDINKNTNSVDLRSISLITLYKMNQLFLKYNTKFEVTFIPPNYHKHNFLIHWGGYQYGSI